MRTSEQLGTRIGEALAPVFEKISRARGARTFHPRGDLARVTVSPLDARDGLQDLGAALAGNGFVRFSNALWKAPRWPDALGCAIAFTDAHGKAEQHLLMATILRPWTMPIAPFTTDTTDYVANTYYAVSPFSTKHLEKVWLRMRVDERPESRAGEARRALFAREVQQHCTFVLEGSSNPYTGFAAFARVRLEELLPEGADSPALALDPFVDARGLYPRGFIHALRHGAYAGSRAGREKTPQLEPIFSVLR